MDRGVAMVDNDYFIEFAANELRQDEVLMVSENSLEGSGTNYNQAIQLERGWNLVSWYLQPEDPTPWDELFMDDLFANQDWFEYDQQEPVDMVGKYDNDPRQLAVFPALGSGNDPQQSWQWELKDSYTIYLERPAHFWEFTARPIYDPVTNDLTPSDAWDEFREVGLNNPGRPTHWYFIAYPLRKQIKIEESNTVAWLFDDQLNPDNPLFIIKDDAGNWYRPGIPHPTLNYLTPGKGYFLGFTDNATVQDCPWFSNEGTVPECIPPDPKMNQQTISSASHFQFKSRTHWSYPIQIDTVVIEGLLPEIGDEIGVFDGELCVGAKVFDGEYPICMAAWKDDIATLNDVDGYLVNSEIIFKWFDASENQEITFMPPPQTQAVEANPYFPTHSGFGMGFSAVRSLVNGVQSVTQLPKTYKLMQNYPNPFNAETVIPLELPERSKIRLEIFNVHGQKLGMPYKKVFDAGKHKIRWDAGKLPSGVYFYRIMAKGLERNGQYTNTGKMLMLK